LTLVVLKLFRMSERERGTKRQRDEETKRQRDLETERQRGGTLGDEVERQRVRKPNRRSQKTERDTERRD